MRVYGVSLFLLWMVPFFSMAILFAAFDLFVTGSYVGLPCPGVPILLAIAELMRSTTPLPGVEAYFLPPEFEPVARSNVLPTAAVAYAAAGLLAQLARARTRGKLREIGLEVSPKSF
jgi:hypothetical protein